jgi:regulatory protein
MDEARAKNYAVWLLSQQARTEKEIREKLEKKGVAEDTVPEVMEALRRWGYLDDAGLANRWAESRGRTRGKRAIAFELRKKGIAEETVKETLESRTDEDEAEACLRAATRKVGEHPKDTSREAQARLAAFLQRRGFSWDAIRPALRTLYAEMDALE